MKNPSSIALLLIVAAASPVSSSALAQESDSVCYIQTSSGQTIDLAGMCSGNSQFTPARITSEITPNTKSRANRSTSPALEISGVKVSQEYNENLIPYFASSGKITNRSDEQVMISRLIAVQNGKTIGIIASSTIAPGKSVNFKDARVSGDPVEGEAEVTTWVDATNTGHQSNFAYCRFTSNVASEKHCKQR